MSDTYAPLLPPHQTALEGLLVQVGAVSPGTVAGITALRTLYTPSHLDAALLPWLAWSWDVLQWPAAAALTAQRESIAASFTLHRQAGTLGSYRRLARAAGFALLAARRPPDKTYLGAALTSAERTAWLERFPQLRLYPYRSRGHASGSHLGQCCVGQVGGAACWPAMGDAAARIGERAYLYRAGAETPLVTATVVTSTRESTVTTVTEARLPGRAGRGTWCGQFSRYTVTTDAPQRLYRVITTVPVVERAGELRLSAITPGLTPMQTRYTWVAGSGTAHAPLTVFASRGFCAGHLADHDAGRRIFRRVYLFDPAVAAVTRGRGTHLNATRLGLAPFHAVLAVDARRQWSRRVACCPRPVGAHLANLDAGARITALRSALEPLRAARDRVHLQTKTHRLLTARNRLLASPGTLAGTMIQEVF